MPDTIEMPFEMLATHGQSYFLFDEQLQLYQQAATDRSPQHDDQFDLWKMFPELREEHALIKQLFHKQELTLVRRATPFVHPQNGRVHTVSLRLEKFPALPNCLILLINERLPESGRSSRQPAEEVAVLKRRNRELLLLNHAGRVLTATLEMDDLLSRLLQVATEIIGAEGSSVWLLDDEDQHELICRAAFHQKHDPQLIGQRLQAGEGVAGWVAQKGESTIVARAEDDPRFFSQMDKRSGFSTRSLVSVPLRVRDVTIGVLQVVNKVDGVFNANDLAAAETLASSASIAIDNARMVQRLHDQNDDLEARNQELDAFAHTVAHDLQNPLALILGFTEVLNDDEEMDTNSRRMRILRTIASNVQKMSSIVQELLLLSSVRQTEVTTTEIDMRPIVHAALARMSYMCDEYGAIIHHPPSWPMAMGYGPWVEEVWENYFSNAMKYGGTPPELWLGADEEEDGWVRFWVRDNGAGITASEQAQLFTPFTRLSEIRAMGHGLGLSIVRRIMDKLNGQVGVESELGVGSTFWFKLPALPDEEAASA